MEKENKVVVNEVTKEVELNYFEKLYKIDVNEHTEKKKELTYLSWAWAWAEVKKLYPNINYSVVRFEHNQPYVFDEKTGYMVFTNVTLNGQTHEMWLPVMDSNNRAQYDHDYVVKTKNGDILVKQATMFDVNKTIMRCLTKNLAMFGLGLYIYAGSDLPESSNEIAEIQKPKEVEVKDIVVKDKDEPIRPNTKQQVADLYEALATPRKVGFNGWLQKTFNAISFDDLTEAQGRVIIKTLSKESK